MGDAVTVTLLLSDWEKYSLSERVSYHFDLTEALAPLRPPKPAQAESAQQLQSTTTAARSVNHSKVTEQNESSTSDSPNQYQVCGVAGLLECIPFTPLYRLTKRQKRTLRNDIQSFNINCSKARQQEGVFCHEPRRLPLRLNPASRVYFAYEVTRMVFCLDASPTLTSTFGGMGDMGNDDGNNYCCPMDRVAGIVQLFFQALAEPIEAPSIPTNQGMWRPELNVTAIAVYPRGTGQPHTGLLVRDFRVHDLASAELLAKKIEEWALGEVETEISRRLSTPNPESRSNNLFCGFDAWAIPLHSSSLRDMLDAADVSLSILSSKAKPCIVVATDGRSVSCDGVMDILTDADRADIPVVVLDLSSPQSHSQKYLASVDEGVTPGNKDLEASFIQYDPGGPATFPLHLSDDSEALYGICKATGGCFFDFKLLREAAKSKAGEVTSESPLCVDHYFAFKRRSIKPNAVQWYILFNLSPLSPTLNSSWGRILPPWYLRTKPHVNAKHDQTSSSQKDVSWEPRPPGWVLQPSSDFRRDNFGQRKNVSRTTFSTYIVNPIRIKGLLMTRVKEGYRAKQYGQSTQDSDKVLIQFNLPLELGTVLHYELSYKALPNQSHLVGVAHIKIELSGEPSFILSVKNDFLRQTHVGKPVTMAQQISARLCRILRWIRREDCLQSYLCPLRWSDQLSGPDTPFVRRLETLTSLQRRRHFRFDEFDVMCTGRMPYNHDDGFLSEFMNIDDGEQELVETITDWSTQTVKEGRHYIKQTDRADDKLANYCVVELIRSPLASRLFTISVEFFGGTPAYERLDLLNRLKGTIAQIKEVEVLPKQMGKYVVGHQNYDADRYFCWMQSLLKNQHHHARWDLVKDPEILPLLMKRRAEIGKFYLLDSSDDHALFAKLVQSTSSSEEDLAQYHIAILSDRVVIDLQMESSCGDFFPFRHIEGLPEKDIPQFHKTVRTLKRRDQECGHALRCRTHLLGVLDDTATTTESPGDSLEESVERLIPYSSKMSRKLRFFQPGAGSANDVLHQLSEEMLLSGSLGVQIARLPIDSVDIGGVGSGSWFVVQFDRHTMSLLHLSLLDEHENEGEDVLATFRHVSFFTLGISDLYSTRDDVADDDSTTDHISEHFCVTEFADLLDVAHARNYSAAVYLALRCGSLDADRIHQDDLKQALSVCEFAEVASVWVAGTPMSPEGGCETEDNSKLLDLIGVVLGQVVGCEGSCLKQGLWYAQDRDVVIFKDANESDSLSAYDDLDAFSDGAEFDMEMAETDRSVKPVDEYSDLFSRSDDDPYDRPHGPSDETGNLDLDPLSGPSATNILNGDADVYAVDPPIFVRFTLDGKVARLTDLANITKSSSLAAHLSMFSSRRAKKTAPAVIDPSQIPGEHGRVAMELETLLNAYVAEQTIERLRHFGLTITEADLRVVKTCLRVVPHENRKIELYFYSGKKDAMVPAFAPAGGEAASIDQGFVLLVNELQKNKMVVLKAFSGDVFVVVDSQQEAALDYWCFISVRRSRGLIDVKVYHPTGSEMASIVMTKVLEMILVCCHRVNQRLLLKRLHQSRTASELLIPKDPMLLEEPESAAEQIFRPGVFGCPIVFRTSFELFHRCATNPAQVARKLESTVLHSFAVSNRRNVFVYKNETGAVFYMMLEASGGGVGPDGHVALVVHGIHEPGPSITKQLTQLLQKRLLQIAVDMLSMVLTKNPHFHWKEADLNLIDGFERDWKSLDDNRNADLGKQDMEYQLPPRSLQDPGIILLDLRQNLCGSTFIHRLNGTIREGESSDAEEDGDLVEFNVHDFTFYYNNNPSKLDPEFQSVSTLTERGAAYSREAGAGIAIIKFTLVHANGEPVQKLRFGVPVVEVDSIIDVPVDALRLNPVELSSEFPAEETVPPTKNIHIRVSITATALKRQALHSWILLTLNQSYASWNLERQLEKMQHQMLRSAETNETLQGRTCQSSLDKSFKVDSVCRGLPAVISIMEKTHVLPHPAFAKAEETGAIRASSVATLALDLLDTIISMSSSESRKGTAGIDDLVIVRLSRGEEPRLVKLKPTTAQREAVEHVCEQGSGTVLKDKSIDCPEYICFSCHPFYTESHDPSKSFPTMFKEVVVDDGNSDKSSSILKLENLKAKQPSFFTRSFAFVLSVKRNQRTLLAYNWNPHLFKTIAARFLERDRAFCKSIKESIDALQLCTLNLLSPPTEGAARRPERENDALSSPSRERRVEKKVNETKPPPQPILPNKDDDVISSSGKKPRASRPEFIRRPKLIGKSVEGAAMQAVAASRARASNKQRFRGGHTLGSSQPQKGLRDDGKGAPDGVASSPKVEAAISAESQASGDPKETKKRDEALEAAKNKFQSFIHASSAPLLLRHARHIDAVQQLAALWWPIQAKQPIPRTVGDFFLSRSPCTWSDVSRLVTIPSRLVESFAVSLAQTIAIWNPGVTLMQVNPQGVSGDSAFLMGEIRNVHSCKCVAVFKVSATKAGAKGRQKDLIRSQGWVITLPRHIGGDRRQNTTTVSLTEKDAAALDKLTIDMHAALFLDSLIFDHICFTVERVMKSLDQSLRLEEIFLIRNVVARYPLPSQRCMPSLNYRAYQCNLVLASFKDYFIQIFSGAAPMLYDWLYRNAADHSLIKCGKDGLCFKEEIVAFPGTHAIAFLSCHQEDNTKMQLLILCRTQGKDIYDYMFREGSNTAISVLDNIGSSAAGLAYEALLAASCALRRDQLWDKLSHPCIPAQEEVEELLCLTNSKRLIDQLSSIDAEQVALVLESVTDWRACCSAMANQVSFSPWHKFERGPQTAYLFFLKDKDLFLLIRVHDQGHLGRLDLIVKEENENTVEPEQKAIQALTNYLLHYLWFSL